LFDTLRDNSRIIVYLVVIAFVISGGFMGYGAYLNNSGGGQQPAAQNVIAEVNGQEISQQEYLSMLQRQAPQQNLNGTQVVEFRFNILEALIERRLILQQADQMNITAEVSDDELEESYQNILEQNDLTEEELSQNLAEQNYTIGALREDIRNNLRVSKRIRSTVEAGRGDLTVSEEEVRELYTQRYPQETAESSQAASGEDSEVPVYADIKDDLESEIMQQKENQALNEWLNGLKSEAEIVINDPVLSAYNEFDSGNYEKASESFAALLEDEGSPVLYSYLARSYSEAGNAELAEETYNQAVNEYPENTDLLFSYAQFLSNEEKQDEAVEQLKQVSSLAGDDFMTRYQLYMMFTQMGAEEEAEEELQVIQRLNEERNNQQQAEEDPEISSEDLEENISDQNSTEIPPAEPSAEENSQDAN